MLNHIESGCPKVNGANHILASPQSVDGGRRLKVGQLCLRKKKPGVTSVSERGGDNEAPLAADCISTGVICSPL